MHTALVAGWAGSMALYELAGMFVIPFMTRLGITNSWGGWSITGGTVTNPGIWSYEGVAGAHIVMNVQKNPLWICQRSLEFIYFSQGWLALVLVHFM
ncbi:hypothetical protein R3W88_030161 [Solanum pinnatisectum]|uniref:Uncharacterized protein n=1 Tax=Solanum pinnatisectum TaxID=50273 RepID=A0AAV9K7T2_9SOLN|nr:hypothetical protein R3W88_030161 [Solanum pinnatisectum]